MIFDIFLIKFQLKYTTNKDIIEMIFENTIINSFFDISGKKDSINLICGIFVVIKDYCTFLFILKCSVRLSIDSK